MKWHEKIIAAHLQVADAVGHGEKMQSERYFVWQEDGGNKINAESRANEETITGTTDFFTKMEFDPWADEIKKAFDDCGIAWYQNSIQYEPDTKFWHYEWVWEVTDG